jgi:hypothetical protein
MVDACEDATRRMVLEPDGCAHPIRSLFRQIRHLFPLGAQLDARSIVRLHVDAGRILAARLEATLRRECQAFTRKGTPCRREARPGQRFCPSHRHLDEVVIITEDEGYPAGEGMRLRAAAAG